MDTVFVVVYQQWDDFEVLEVFKTRESAECYIGNFPYDERYLVDNFIILEKKLFN